MKAVDIHADLLREAASDVGNDHRLGANEAPPAIISIFVGDQLEDVIDQLCNTGEATHSKKGGKLMTGVATLPDLDKDATDRNRTSPFAFTGNKFEFRMVGSSDSVAPANVVLNTIVAESFKEAADELEKADDFDMAVHDMIKKLLADHREIPNYGHPGRGPRLLRGMTLAIEPMVNAGAAAIQVLSDGWTVKTLDGKWAGHYENTILITDGEPEILTAPAI